jgi:hypothetical protein
LTKASLPWRDDFVALSGLRKPGLGQGSGPGMNEDSKDLKYKELIE